MASPQRPKLNMTYQCCGCTNSRHVNRDGVRGRGLKMFSRCTCTVDADTSSTITRKVPPHSSPFSLGVCSILIPAVPRFFEDIKRVSKITFQRCPFLRKEEKGSASVFGDTLLPSWAPLRTQKNLAAEVSTLPSKPGIRCQHGAPCPWERSLCVAFCRTSTCCQ